MADTYTTGLKNFIINNINGGYITSTTTISTSDLNARINEIIGTTYTKIADLHNVAFSGDYTKLKNTPQLADVALTGDYGDLKNTPQLSNVALSGSYYDLPDRPDLSATIQSELGDTVDEAILNVKNQILGQNVTSNYNTLEKLQNRKAEVIYIDVTSNEYGNLNNFGNSSFNTTNHELIDAIIENFYLNKIIILQGNYGNFIVTNLLNNNNYTQISALKFSSNYNDLTTQFEIDNPESTFEEYIINNIKLIYDELYIIYDKTKNIVFYFYNMLDLASYIATTSNLQDNLMQYGSQLSTINSKITTLETKYNTIDDTIGDISDSLNGITNRIELLESYHSSSEPTEPTEP